MSTPQEVTDQDFDSVVLSSSQPVLVDFWAPWCGPCRQMAPILDEVAEELSDRLVVAKVNVDECPQTARQYSIVSIPTFILFRDGKVSETFVGGSPKAKFKAQIEAAL